MGSKSVMKGKRENIFIRFIVDIYLFSRDMKVFTDPYLTVVVGKFEHMCVRAILQYLQAVGQKKKKMTLAVSVIGCNAADRTKTKWSAVLQPCVCARIETYTRHCCLVGKRNDQQKKRSSHHMCSQPNRHTD